MAKRIEDFKAIIVYGIYAIIVGLFAWSAFVAAKHFTILISINLVVSTATFLYTFLLKDKIMRQPWLYLSFFIFLDFLMMFAVIVVTHI